MTLAHISLPIRQQLEWASDDKLAKAAQEGDKEAELYLSEKYRPLVWSVVSRHRKYIEAHYARPDPEKVADWLCILVFPGIIDAWDPEKGGFTRYASRYGRFKLQNELRRKLAKSDPQFIYDSKTHEIVSYPRRFEPKPPHYRSEEESWTPAKASDLFRHPRTVQRGAFKRQAMIATNGLANDELTPEEIAKLVGDKGLELLALWAEGELSDSELANQFDVHRTTIGRWKLRLLLDLFDATEEAKDRRLKDLIDRNTSEDIDEPEIGPDEQRDIDKLKKLVHYHQMLRSVQGGNPDDN